MIEFVRKKPVASENLKKISIMYRFLDIDLNQDVAYAYAIFQVNLRPNSPRSDLI